MLTYGSENWTLNKSDRRKIEAAEMRFLRSVAGFTLLDHKRSEDVRAELKIFNLNDKLLQCSPHLWSNASGPGQNKTQLPPFLTDVHEKGKAMSELLKHGHRREKERLEGEEKQREIKGGWRKRGGDLAIFHQHPRVAMETGSPVHFLVILRRFINISGYLASELNEGNNASEMGPGSSTDSYPAFAHIGLRENPGKNLN
ncbi:hypothetical protein ANN_12457 [Periplaneta americana]|uniref:Uncharacterized protein n=1 Tax=Periplaneta americana TaxID=6978 RepID=A0ABQ8TJ43_PERAM|nr:hypothetical protein ANN_12457 [Periplaneta americana]